MGNEMIEIDKDKGEIRTMSLRAFLQVGARIALMRLYLAFIDPWMGVVDVAREESSFRLWLGLMATALSFEAMGDKYTSKMTETRFWMHLTSSCDRLTWMSRNEDTRPVFHPLYQNQAWAKNLRRKALVGGLEL